MESWLQVKEPQTRIRDLSSGVEGNPALESPICSGRKHPTLTLGYFWRAGQATLSMTAATGCFPSGAGCPLLAPWAWLDLPQAGLSLGELSELRRSTEPKPGPLEKPQYQRHFNFCRE